MNTTTIVRRASELDVGQVFKLAGQVLIVLGVSDFCDETQGAFTSLTVRDVNSGVEFWCPIRPSTLVERA